MSELPDQISHEGIVTKIENDSVFVMLLVKSACAACEVKGACNLSEMEEKLIEVTHVKEDFRIGEKVNISMKSSLGYKALFFGYLLPFLVLVISIIVFINIFDEEGIAAGIGLFLTAIYYITLYFFRDRLKRIFTYQISKVVE